MSNSIKRLLSLVALLTLIFTACSLPSNATPTPINYIQTAAAGTVIAQITQAAATNVALDVASSTPLPSTAVPANTAVPATAAPTNTPVPALTNTPLPPTNTSVIIPCDRGQFVEDVNYPDNTEVVAGSSFVKTWRLKNNGSCTWNSSYSLVFEKGDSMLPSGSQSSFQLTTSTVVPGQQMDLSVTLKAPDKAGTYQGYWLLRNASNVLFGIGDQAAKSFWVKVKVVEQTTPTPSASVQFDLLAKGQNAEWHNATTILPWGDSDDDALGVAVVLENVKLNNGKTQARVLATYPQRITDGVIYGVFSAYTVQEKDRFRASLGLRSPCENGNVKFQVKYREGGSEVSLGEWIKSCDSSLLDIDIDLAGLKGKSVQFLLLVSANGAFDSDKAVWLAPRVER